MVLQGHFKKVGKLYAIECPLLGLITQARNKKEIQTMTRSYLEDFEIKVESVKVCFKESSIFIKISEEESNKVFAYILRTHRMANNKTFEQVAKDLGLKSKGNYFQYEKGRLMEPGIFRAMKLFKVVSGKDLIISV
jgi:hypothetical protein